MAFIESTAGELFDPLVNLWNGFVFIFPRLIVALVIVIIGYLIALITGHVIKVVISKLKIDHLLGKMNMPKTIGKLKISSVLGEITKWYIFIIFLQAAVDAVNLGTLSILLAQFVLWLPQLIVAVIAVLTGLFLAHYLSHLIERETNMKGVKFISSLFKVVIVFLAIVIALEQIGVRVNILQNAFLILLASAGFGFALAIGLAFGLGLKDQAQIFYNKLKKKM